MSYQSPNRCLGPAAVRLRTAVLACAAWTVLLGLIPIGYTLWVLVLTAPASPTGRWLHVTLGALMVAGVVELARGHRAVRLSEAFTVLAADRPTSVLAVASRRSDAHSPWVTPRVASLPMLPAAAALLDAPLAVAFLLLLGFVHPLLCTAGLGGALLLWASLDMRGIARDSLSDEAAERVAAADAAARQCFAQAVNWQALGMQEALTQRWAVLQQQADGHQQALGRKSIAHLTGLRALMRVLGLALLGLSCGWLLQTSFLSAGWLIVASLLGAQAVMPLLTLIAHAPVLGQVPWFWRRLNASPADPVQSEPPTESRTSLGSLVVEHVTLFPPPDFWSSHRSVPAELNFQLAPGEMLGILGPTGAGKSTLARVLAGQQSPVFGTVALDGVPLSDFARQTRRPGIGYLSQQTEVCAGSLANFVGRSAPPDPAMLRRALNDAGLFSWVQSLPETDQTWLDRGVDGLSAGWCRRLGLARALYGRPSLLVLDEPTAGLDREGERALEQALAECKARGCRVVVVSRRASMLRLADRLLVLREGRAAAYGPKSDLLNVLIPAIQVPLDDTEDLKEAVPIATRRPLEVVQP